MTNYSENAVADKFYTKPEVALDCIKTLNLERYDLIIEPSAGSWAFSRWLPEEKTFSFDLFPDPEWPLTIQCDYYKFDLDSFVTERSAKEVLIIGNPPYGRMSSMAMDFVKKSCVDNKLLDYRTTVGFILSNAFSKKSFQRRVPETHSLTQCVHLGSPFTVDGEDYGQLNTGWFVWEPIPREKEVIRRTSLLISKHKKEDFENVTGPKCAFRTHGSGAGTIFWSDWKDLNPNTTRFLSGPGVSLLEEIDWKKIKSKTIGIPCIGFGEIVEEVERIYNDGHRGNFNSDHGRGR